MDEHVNFDENDLNIITHVIRAGMIRMDEGLSLFLARQLDFVKSRAYEVEYAPMSAMAIFPVTSEIPDYARTFTYGIFDSVGMAKIIADYSDDLPMVDENYREETGRVYRVGDAYAYSLDEVKAANATGRNLSDRKANTARKAFDIKVNDLVWKGDTAHQILGVFAHPNIPVIASAGWTDGGVAVAELETAITNIKTLTKGTHNANKIVIPPSVNKVFSKREDGTTMSVRDYFNSQYPGMQWAEAWELEDIDGAGTKAAIVFEFDADNLSVEMPEPFNQLAPQPNNLHWKVPCTGKVTGLTVYRPLTLQFITGL